jgi:hypothetical protein
MLVNDPYHHTLIEIASSGSVSSRAAIRALYVAGYETPWIAETCMLPLGIVQDAINRIP